MDTYMLYVQYMYYVRNTHLTADRLIEFCGFEPNFYQIVVSSQNWAHCFNAFIISDVSLKSSRDFPMNNYYQLFSDLPISQCIWEIYLNSKSMLSEKSLKSVGVSSQINTTLMQKNSGFFEILPT